MIEKYVRAQYDHRSRNNATARIDVSCTCDTLQKADEALNSLDVVLAGTSLVFYIQLTNMRSQATWYGQIAGAWPDLNRICPSSEEFQNFRRDSNKDILKLFSLAVLSVPSSFQIFGVCLQRSYMIECLQRSLWVIIIELHRIHLPTTYRKMKYYQCLFCLAPSAVLASLSVTISLG